MEARDNQALRDRTPGGRFGRLPRNLFRGAPAGLAVLLVLTMGACEADSSPSPTPTATAPSPVRPVSLSFGVYGPPEEIAAFQGVVDSYNALSEGSEVSLRSWPDRQGLLHTLESGGAVPDVFLSSQMDLVSLRELRLTAPVDELLDERGVDFGDGYSRDALQAFSADNRLQCMPYGISPRVIYYNKDLVDFDRMAARGLEVPDLTEDSSTTWSFEEFQAAAEFATRPRKGTRGLYIEPTLRGLAPFVVSGGGTLFDDPLAPTSLAFSDGDTRAALERALELLRDPLLTLTERQLAEASPLEWFEQGRVAMIAGTRELVPRLRQVQALNFDVMPMPTLDTAATTGDITGMCLSAQSEAGPDAADFMVYALSSASVRRVVRAGYLAPANLEVALSDDFLQPGRQPEHAEVFNSSVGSMLVDPPLSSWTALEQAVAASLRLLISVPVLDLESLTTRIDEESRVALNPDGPSDGPTEGSS